MTRSQKTLLAVISLLCGRAACGDTFTYLDQDGQSITVEAKLVGEGQGAFALELPDGELRPIPIGAVQNRQPGDDPEPDSPKVVLDRLREKFGEEKFRGLAENSYAIGLVLAAPLPKPYENRAAACLKKAAKFFKTVEGVFLEFLRDMKTETKKPRYPLVILIFETDDDFEKYAHEDTGGRGLSAGNILGYYNLLTNHLNIRMSECHPTPLTLF